jgi:hypothetical protein
VEVLLRMPIAYLSYQLQDGYIHNWLVAGPQALAVTDLERFDGENFKLPIARHYYEPESGITQPPVEHDTFAIGDATWVDSIAQVNTQLRRIAVVPFSRFEA